MEVEPGYRAWPSHPERASSRKGEGPVLHHSPRSQRTAFMIHTQWAGERVPMAPSPLFYGV